VQLTKYFLQKNVIQYNMVLNITQNDKQIFNTCSRVSQGQLSLPSLWGR